jgi:hypothetical protein
MLKNILSKLTPAEREWLLKRLGNRTGAPRKVTPEQQVAIFDEFLAFREADGWAHGLQQRAVGDIANRLGTSDKTVERALLAEGKRRAAQHNSIVRFFERLRRQKTSV